MPIRSLVYAPDMRLKKICKEVANITDDLRQLAEDMVETMYENKGIGLAAPQVGENICLFVMDCEQGEDGEKGTVYKLFNPVITWHAEETDEYEEGCLSLPEILQLVARPTEVTVKYLNEKGEKQSLEAEGLMAKCIQHEIDHLNGKLLLDYMGPVKRRMALKKLEKIKKERA